MLHHFLAEHRELVVERSKALALATRGARLSSASLDAAWGVFFDEITGLMSRDEPFEVHGEEGLHTVQAEKQGKEYLRLGYTISEVVHSYGILCQVITGLADEKHFTISSREFRQFNLSLDTAIAEAVTEFEKERRVVTDDAEVKRLGYLAHELRNCLQTATLALDIIEIDHIDVRRNTSTVLRNSLATMGALIDTTLAEIRLRSEVQIAPKPVRVREVLDEVAITSGYDAASRNLTLHVAVLDEVRISVDRHLIVSALSNLVQNALKFSHKGGVINVRALRLMESALGDRVHIEVEDSCGGLPPGKIEDLFTPGVQRSPDKSGLGLGLAISREAIERNNGSLSVRNVEGKGCVFVIDLPTFISAD